MEVKCYQTQVCSTHCEAKETKMWGLGAEKGLLHDHARKQVAHNAKNPKLPESLQQNS